MQFFLPLCFHFEAIACWWRNIQRYHRSNFFHVFFLLQSLKVAANLIYAVAEGCVLNIKHAKILIAHFSLFLLTLFKLFFFRMRETRRGKWEKKEEERKKEIQAFRYSGYQSMNLTFEWEFLFPYNIWIRHFCRDDVDCRVQFLLGSRGMGEGSWGLWNACNGLDRA